MKFLTWQKAKVLPTSRKFIWLLQQHSLKNKNLPVCQYTSTDQREKKQLGFTASTKQTLDEAFKFLQDIIDGKPCVITESQKFFSLLPKDLTMDCIRSFFFELYEIAVRAEMPSAVCIKRFLTIIPGGKRLFIERKYSIKVQMSANDMAE